MGDQVKREPVPAGNDAELEDEIDDVHAPPRGTLMLMLIYLIIIIGIFGSIYLTLLSRG